MLCLQQILLASYIGQLLLIAPPHKSCSHQKLPHHDRVLLSQPLSANAHLQRPMLPLRSTEADTNLQALNEKAASQETSCSSTGGSVCFKRPLPDLNGLHRIPSERALHRFCIMRAR